MKTYVKGLGFFLISVLCLSCFTGCSQSNNDSTSDIQWDEEVDFLVVGYGLAGQAAALEASDIAGESSILVLEKMNEEQAGGNSIASGQTFIIPAEDDKEKFKTYLEACNEPNPIPDEYLTWLVDRFADQTPWISASMDAAGYEIGYVGGGPARWGSLVVEFKDLPGADFKGASAHIRTKGSSFETGGLWHGFNAAVKMRDNVEVRYGNFATELVQDPITKRVEGVISSDWEGNETYIKANNGVLLSCGGFENNLQMQKDFHGVDMVKTSGTPGNTGDGIKMLMEVGAQMWHMNNQTQSGGYWLGVQTPEFESTFILNMTFKTGSYVQVGANNERFYDEAQDYHRQHMKAKEYGKYLDLPHDRALPVHFIFDENFRENDTVITPWLSWPITTEKYAWSKGNVEEIEKGWIVKADTIEELAVLIDRDPIELKATIDRYNEMAISGVDTDFNRDPSKMQPISQGPYYAVEVTPTLVATTGGAVRNTKSQVLNWDGNPIDNLYEAGELGSYVSNLYQNGVFLSEAIASGRAAAQDAFGIQSTVTSDFKVLDEAVKAENSIFADENAGAYELAIEGRHGEFKLNIKISEGKISLVSVLEGEDNMFMEPAQLQELVNEFVSQQSVEVDVVSGATEESQAIIDAMKKEFE